MSGSKTTKSSSPNNNPLSQTVVEVVPPEAPISIEVQNINSCLTQFSNIVTNSVQTPVSMKQASLYMRRAVSLLLTNTNTDTFNAFATFFKNNADKCMSERNIFIGINYLIPRDRNDVMYVWSAFRWYFKLDNVPFNMGLLFQETRNQTLVNLLNMRK